MSTASQEKRSAAISSLIAALALTSFKAVVGFATGSLGILAEAAHSALDLMAALMTVVAVGISDRPADEDHPYGHGRVENLSAMFETLLLIVTCGWIIYEAVSRLASGKTDIVINAWSFIVVITSIVVDYSRSRVLSRVAKKHHSQALEADALHFETDIWSSAVVLVGLIAVGVAHRVPGLEKLVMADAVAALVVAAIVIWISLQLGLRTVHALLDTVPRGLHDQIRRQVEELPGVLDCHNIRMRYIGPRLIVDVHTTMDGSLSLRAAHDLTERIEEAIRGISPDADVTVHPEPGGHDGFSDAAAGR